MTSYISDKPILRATSWRRVTIVPSSVAGKVNVVLADGSQLSIAPDGSEAPMPHGTDGAWEQATAFGSRIVYDYDGLAAPVVYDAMVSA